MKDNLKEILEQTDSVEAGKTLRAWLRHRTREALLEIVEEEVENLCGPRHGRGKKGDHFRSGSAPSSVYIGSERQELKRPRVRRKQGKKSAEVVLKSWKLARDPNEWEETMMRAILWDVSCRGMGRLRGSELLGESKSSLSRLWQRKAGVLVEEMQESDMAGFDLLVCLMQWCYAKIWWQR